MSVDELWPGTLACVFKAVESRFDISQVCTARIILELVFILSGYFQFSNSRDSISMCKVEILIQFLCTR